MSDAKRTNSAHPVCLDCERSSKALEAAAQMNGTYAKRIEHLELALAEWEKERLFLQAEVRKLQAFKDAYKNDAKEVAHWARELGIPTGTIGSIVARMGMELQSLRGTT